MRILTLCFSFSPIVKATVIESTTRLVGRSARPLKMTIDFPLTIISDFPVVALWLILILCFSSLPILNLCSTITDNTRKAVANHGIPRVRLNHFSSFVPAQTMRSFVSEESYFRSPYRTSCLGGCQTHSSGTFPYLAFPWAVHRDSRRNCRRTSALQDTQSRSSGISLPFLNYQPFFLFFLFALPFRCLLILSLMARFLLLGDFRYEILTPPVWAVRAVPSSRVKQPLGIVRMPFQALGFSPKQAFQALRGHIQFIIEGLVPSAHSAGV